jgi:transcription antitermination factor NusG
MDYQDRSPAWFAVQTKLRYESVSSTVLSKKGYEVFFPSYKQQRNWSDRNKLIELPLFPGYTFCRFNPSARLPILCTVGVLSVVGDSSGPLPVDPGEISAVRQIVASGVYSEPAQFDPVGRAVRIEKGPLAGLEGTVINVKNSLRLIVSVTLLRRSVSAEVDRDWLRILPQEKTA